MIGSELDVWIEKDGEKFLKEIGLKEGQTVLDFGCGRGHYSIPASNLVGAKGRVYALDKNRSVLNKLKRTVEKSNIKNLKLINGERDITVGDNSVDVVLCYDVLHYSNLQERMAIYSDIWRVLKERALFSVYPKHCKGNLPSGELADVSIGAVTEEIEDAGFIFSQKIRSRLLHDSSFDEGFILNFRKGG